MEAELKAIEKFWSSIVTEDGLATYLSSTFKVSPNDEVKALALLTRVTFLLSVGMKNDRDDSVRNEEYLLTEIIKIGKNCPSYNICCQKTKLAIDGLVKNFKHCGHQANDITSMSHDGASENLTLADRTKSHERGEFLFNRQYMEKNSLVNKLKQPDQILALESQELDACLPNKNVCVIPETMVIENSQYGRDTIFEKTPNKGVRKVLKQNNEDFNIFNARENGDNNWEEELGNIDDSSLSPIVGKKQNVQRNTKNGVICSSNNMCSSPEIITYGSELEKRDRDLPTQINISALNSDFPLNPLSYSNNKRFTPRLDTQIECKKSLDKNPTASDSRDASTDNFIVPQIKRSLDFTKSAGYKLTRNKMEKQDSKLLTLNQDNLNSKCLMPEALSNSPSLLTCSKGLLPERRFPSQLDINEKTFESSKKLSTVLLTPGKPSNLDSKNFTNATETPKQNHNVSICELSRSSSDIICSLSSNLVDEHVPSNLDNVVNICSPPKKKLSSIRKHKSQFCTLPISTSKVKAEISFNSAPKKILRQTTLTQDCFLRKPSSDNRKKLRLMDKDDSILNTAIEKSLKTKETEDILRKKKDQLIKINDTGKINLASPAEMTSLDEFEKDLFVGSPEEVPKKHLLINSEGYNKENSPLNFENKMPCIGAKSTAEVNSKDNLQQVNTNSKSTKLNEDEILAQLEVDSQEMDVHLKFNNSFKPKKQLEKRFEKVELSEDSFDFVPAKAEEPSYAYKGAVIRKKAEKHKVDGWECHECKDYFHSKGLNEEQKKAVLNKCSRHRSKFKHVMNTPKGFWNADWDSINEANETQFENCQSQNVFSKSKKKHSKESFAEPNEVSSRVSGQKSMNLNHQDISMSIDDKKKTKSKRNHNIMELEIDSIGVGHESIEFGKVKKDRSKNIDVKSGKKDCSLQKLEAEASHIGCWDDTPFEGFSTSKDKSKKAKRKRKSHVTDMEFEALGDLLECKKSRKEKDKISKELELSENESIKEKKVENAQLRYLEEGWIQTRSLKL